jgi:MFS transporter, DHA3 family, multidrug efflux protein
MDMSNQRVFYHLLGNSLIATVTNMFVWFAVTFWVFLETQSVLATSYIAGIFALSNMFCAFVFGTIVDHNRKKMVMMYSSLISLAFYALGAAIYFLNDPSVFKNPASVTLWALVITLMFGSIMNNLRYIALSTTVTMLFPEGKDKANGLVGAVQGIGFSLTSVLSGLAIGFGGMDIAIVAALIATVIALLHLPFVPLVEKEIVHVEGDVSSKFDLKGTFAVVAAVPGLIMLIFFTTFNNFLGGVFMGLMDAYGLSLVSVQVWGIMFAVVSFGFIASSSFIAKFGLGKNPLRSLLLVNVIAWTTCIFFTIQPSFILLALGMLIWMSIVPFIEAAEHTVVQSVVPLERQGRVFGFAQSIESAASPVTTLLIGPIATFIFIPFMSTGGLGAELIGDWYGVGQARGIALVFSTAGVIGLIVTLIAFKTKAYQLLSKRMLETKI